MVRSLRQRLLQGINIAGTAPIDPNGLLTRPSGHLGTQAPVLVSGWRGCCHRAQAKFAWPQFPWHRVDKVLDRTHRPRLVFTAAIAHGYGTFFFLADENLSHGASAFCDVLERVIEVVWTSCRRSGVHFPTHLVVQSDNTVAQAKNSLVNVFLAYLTSVYKFVTTNLFFLVVGHTHEDIDQMFGVVLTVVLRRVRFQTKEELADAVRERMASRIAARGEDLHVLVLEHIRDFGRWLQPLGVELYNAFMTRHGVESPHAFTYKLRRDLTGAERRLLQASERHGDDQDVLGCVKTYMHSSSLQQAPLLVLPAARRRAAQSEMLPHPTRMMVLEPLKDARRKELRELAAVLRTDTYRMSAGADALDALAAGPPAEQFPPTLWLCNEGMGSTEAMCHTGNELFPHLPDLSWNLLVRFKRT